MFLVDFPKKAERLYQVQLCGKKNEQMYGTKEPPNKELPFFVVEDRKQPQLFLNYLNFKN